MSIPKVIALVGSLCVAVYLGYRYVTADPSGYCRAQNRYINDEEFTRASVAILERDMNEETVYPDGRKVKRKEWSGWYKNIDFDARNPNCCLVLRDDTLSVISRMLGNQEIQVWLNPRTSTQPVVPTDKVLRFHYDVCGNLKDSDIGLPNTAYPVITTTNIGTLHGL